MRRQMIAFLKHAGFSVNERVITSDDFLQADEAFLTNALKPVRWIYRFREKTYTNKETLGIYHAFMKTNPR